MNVRLIILGLSVALLGMPITGMGHAPVPVTGVSIEIEGSMLAVPEDIRLRRADQVIEVTGKLNRRRHNNQSLRGHVDVELVGKAGRVMERESVAIPRSLVSAKHDHFREFSLTLPLPESQNYSVRVRHSMGSEDHQ